jgi:hypothetical protein
MSLNAGVAAAARADRTGAPAHASKATLNINGTALRNLCIAKPAHSFRVQRISAS